MASLNETFSFKLAFLTIKIFREIILVIISNVMISICYNKINYKKGAWKRFNQ